MATTVGTSYWLHSLEKQIAAGQLTVEEAVLMVIDFNSDLDDAQP